MRNKIQVTTYLYYLYNVLKYDGVLDNIREWTGLRTVRECEQMKDVAAKKERYQE